MSRTIRRYRIHWSLCQHPCYCFQVSEFLKNRSFLWPRFFPALYTPPADYMIAVASFHPRVELLLLHSLICFHSFFAVFAFSSWCMFLTWSMFTYRAVFIWVSKSNWFCVYYATRLAYKNSRHFFIQSGVKPKPIVIHSYAFSRALRQLHVTSCFDWFTWLSVSFVIG